MLHRFAREINDVEDKDQGNSSYSGTNMVTDAYSTAAMIVSNKSR